MSVIYQQGNGWIREKHDSQDLHLNSHLIQPKLERKGIYPFITGARKLPGRVDLRQWAPPIKYQGGYNTCSAHVVVELLEYFEKKAFGTCVAASRLFLYKVANNMLEKKGDGGVFIRQVMGVLRSIGAPPEKYWPYLNSGTFTKPKSSDPRIDEEPSAFCYALARDYRAVKYYRLDQPKKPDGQKLLVNAKAHLACQIPFAFGFPLFPSLKESIKNGRILVPLKNEQTIGSHAVVAIGYSDRIEVGDKAKGYPKTKGAFLIQNSWSTDWGENGYGWLPYEYVTQGLCADFWTLTRSKWINLEEAQLGIS
jgi:C1A family cysteine protease